MKTVMPVIAPLQPHCLQAAQFYSFVANLLQVSAMGSTNHSTGVNLSQKERSFSLQQRRKSWSGACSRNVCATMKLALTWISSALIPSSK